LSPEQEVQIAEAIYQYSPSGSDERREITRLLLARYQQGGLSPEQEVQIAEAIYQSSPFGSDERREGFHLLKQYMQDISLALETRLNLALMPCKRRNNNFLERSEAIQILLTLAQKETVMNLLQKHWRSFPLNEQSSLNGQFSLIERRLFKPIFHRRQYDAFIPSIPAIFELACQDVLPAKRRDEMYQLLREMVPLFDQTETNVLLNDVATPLDYRVPT
jgi:hypothetical protein